MKMESDKFINFMMAMVCAPVVMAWVALAGMLIVQAMNWFGSAIQFYWVMLILMI